METSVEFDSDLFKPYLPEDSQVNYQAYGAELAFWLSRKIAEKGVVTSYPNSEDWGWFIEYCTDEEDEYWLCCINRDCADNKWLCYLRPFAKSLFGRNKAKVGNAAPIMEALRLVLNETPEIANVRWSEEDGT